MESVGKLVVIGGLKEQQEIPLPSARFGIGRFFSPESNIAVALDEKSVSRKHAVFLADEQIREYYVIDTHSTYGTYLMINGSFQQLTPDKQERVYNEDVVQFGNAVRVRLLLPCETRGAMTRL
jgi:pSer/pThr/pTyr-binding forkhead associated (FHA) protein